MKCTALVPAYQNIDPDADQCLRLLEREGVPVHREFNQPCIDIARSWMAELALRSGAERILWIDADIVFRPEDALRLIASPEDFICGSYVQRTPGGRTCIRPSRPGPIVCGEKGGLVEIEAAGFGFVAHSAELLRKIGEKLPDCRNEGLGTFKPYFHPIIADGEYHGEDVSFCVRARESGYKLYCDTTIRLLHVGRYHYTWENAEPKELSATVILQPPEEAKATPEEVRVAAVG